MTQEEKNEFLSKQKFIAFILQYFLPSLLNAIFYLPI